MWKKVRGALNYNGISSVEEYAQQPILLNPRIITSNGHMLGERTQLAWGLFQKNIVENIGTWQGFLSKTAVDQH